MKDAAAKVSPKADQPRASSASAERGQQPANLEYRIQGIKSFNRAPTRGYDRAGRG